MEEKKEIKKLFEKYGLWAKKSLGQHFLVDKNVLNKILKAAEISPNDVIVEIGPGLGVLTKKLAQKVKKVIAIEKDEKLAKILKKEILKVKKEKIEIIVADILKFSFSRFEDFKNYKVVANLPYAIAALVIRKFLERKKPPALMILMVQKEVAQKICAQPPKANILSISCQLYSLPKIIRIVKEGSFWPRPKVKGAILKIKPKKKKESFDAQKFFKILKAGFSHPRKQLKNNLKIIFGKKTKEILKSLKIDPALRPQELKVEDWKRLSEKLSFGN